MISRRIRLSVILAFFVCLPILSVSAQQYGDNLLKGMQWRQVGPFRGGRVLAVTGIPGDPYTYYFGGVGGGVWRTTDGGMNWNPLFDRETV